MTTEWMRCWNASAVLPDRRLVRRLDKLVEDLSRNPQASLMKASGNWAGGKAAYRFLG